MRHTLNGLLCLKCRHLERLRNVNLFQVFHNRPVFFKLVGIFVVLLRVLVDLCACSVELAVDCLNGSLSSIFLA